MKYEIYVEIFRLLKQANLKKVLPQSIKNDENN